MAERYSRKELHQHIFDAPDTYIGSIDEDSMSIYYYDENETIKKGKKNVILGLYKIFDEIIVNAADNTVRNPKKCNLIKVNIDKETGYIEVYNNGSDIPIEVHKEEKVYVPEMIFSTLLTSENYDQSDKLVGGKNGFGSKLTNIYSQEFIVEVVDSKRKKYFCQKFYNNMFKRDKAIIKDLNEKKESYVKIRFLPDYKKFGKDRLTEDMYQIMKRRIYDLAGTTSKKVQVFFNDQEITGIGEVNTFEDYIKLYYKDSQKKIIYRDFNERWSVGVVYDSSSQFNHMTFVNKINTFDGGTHLRYITNQIINDITKRVIAKGKENVKVKESHITDNLTIFINSSLEDPDFASQTKEKFTTKHSKFKVKCEIDKKFLDEIAKTGIVDDICEISKTLFKNELSKTDGKKRASMKDIPKLKDATFAGTDKSSKCILIVTEGDSAFSFGDAGREVIGTEFYGVVPLKGKLMNAKKATIEKTKQNDEFKMINKILGLKHNTVYDNTKSLRYGSVLVLTDQDSVSGDTPLLLSNGNNFDIKTIENINDTGWIKTKNNKEISFTKLKIWTETCWTNIANIIRHKVNKRMYRVVTNSGIVDVTEDHSLLNKDCKEISPKMCEIGMELLHSFPKFKVLDDLEDNIFSDNKYDEYTEKYYIMGQLFKETEINYDDINKLLNKGNKYRILFLKGLLSTYNINFNSFDKITLKFDDKLKVQIVYFLLKKLEYEIVLDFDENENMYILNIIKEKTLFHNMTRINKIIDLGIVEDYVYDLETENHHFQAGIGEMIVHNTDGYHIKGLFMNYIHTHWPSLLKINGFIKSLATPIIKVYKTSNIKNNDPLKIFFTQTEFKNWSKDKNVSSYYIKYFKGLGTSTTEEARESFQDFENKLINYIWNSDINNDDVIIGDDIDNNSSATDKTKSLDNTENNNDKSKNKTNKIVKKNKDDIDLNTLEKSDASLILSFGKNFENKRKCLVRNYNPDIIIENDQKQVTYDDFIKKELVHFFHNDTMRSIPNICDGLKSSQRKIIYGTFLRNLEKNEVKVSQLSGYISDVTGYHHGENSLQEAIINMAQDFVGSNNTNLLYPSGTFGTRRVGGKDHASSRYIFTKNSELLRNIFCKEDEPILEYIDEENQIVEPHIYYPIIPIILVNGCDGIGTGYSTTIHPCNPKDIIKNIKTYLNLHKNTDNKKLIKKFIKLDPWYRGFTGRIEKIDDNSYECYGCYEQIPNNENSIRITELPIGTWTQTYLEFLSGLVESNSLISDYNAGAGVYKVNIVVTFKLNVLQALLKNDTLYKELKLCKKISSTNMHLCKICEENNSKVIKIFKYLDTNDILLEYILIRYNAYMLRKNYYLKVLENELDIYKYRKKFIEYYISKKIIVEKRKKEDVIQTFIELKFPQLGVNINSTKSYDYLTSLPIFSLTLEKIEELENLFNKKSQELEIYKNTSVEQLWINDLDKFEKAYDKSYDEYIKRINTVCNNKINKSNKNVIKKK